MRLFFALDLDDFTRNIVNENMIKLNSTFSDGKWVKNQNLHITLQFLGNLEENLLTELRYSGEKIANRMSPSTIRIRKLDAFPSRTTVRTLHYMAEKDLWLEKLGQGLREEMLAYGIHEKQSFSPHITLSRFKHPLTVESSFQWEKHSIDANLKFDCFALKESKLYPSGPVYHTVSKFYVSKEENNGRER